MTDKSGSYPVFGSIAPHRAAMTPIDLLALLGERQNRASVRSYDPSLRDRIAYWVYDKAQSLGIPDPRGLMEQTRFVSDFAPGLGQAQTGEDIGRALGSGDWGGLALAAAGLVPGGRHVGKAAKHGADLARDVTSKTLKNMESRSAFIYDPPAKPPRPFEADYPRGAKTDEAGRLLEDIDGRPLTAEYVVGRQVVGGPDEALPPARFDAVTEGLIGSRHQGYPAGALPRGAVGSYRVGYGADGKLERTIGFRQDLDKASADKVRAHEMGHMIDELSSGIDQRGIKAELSFLYNDLNNPVRNAHRAAGRAVDASKWKGYQGFSPQASGYRAGQSSARELMAEAVRAYLADPNYIKTVAPKTAARIREFVNSNPRLKDIIQFNSLGILATQTEREKGGGS